jgi:PAS domain S-box-containing protein
MAVPRDAAARAAHVMLMRQMRQALGVATPQALDAWLQGLARGGAEAEKGVAALRALFVLVDESYRQFDRAQELRLRSLSASSAELMQANARLSEEAAHQRAHIDRMRTMANRMLAAVHREAIPAGERSADHLIGLLADLITESERAHARLAESEARYRALTSVSSDWYWESDAAGRYAFLSDGVMQLTGLAPDDCAGQTPWDAIGNTADAAPWPEYRTKVAAREAFRDLEVRCVLPNEDIVYFLLSGEPFTDSRGGFKGYRGAARDITARKRTEQRHVEERRLTDVLIESMPMPVSIKDREHRFLRINAAYENLFDLKRAAVLGRTVAEVMPAYVHGGRDVEVELLDAPGVRSYLQPIRSPKGGDQFFIITKATLHGEDGAVTGFVTVHTDITELKRAEQQIADQLQLTNTLLETSPTPTVVKNRDLITITCNTAYERLFEVRREDIIGKPMDAYRESFTRKVFEEEVRLLAAPGSRRDERVLVTPSGKTIPCIVVKSTVRNAAGEVDGLITTVTDITELKRTEEHLIQARQAAESAMQARARFLASMSHEIRTPMNGMLGMASVLEHTPLNDEQREYLATIRESGESLVKIVGDILDFSKIDAGKLEIEETPFDLRARVSSLTQLFAASARGKHLALESRVADDVPAMMAGDPVRLAQAVSNLLANAIKFTASGGVSLAVSVAARMGERRLLKFDVSDTGIGISREAIERIFDPFAQEDSSTTRRFGGTGLGLSIARQLARLMGGEVTVQSEPGKGSVFSLTVNMRVAAGAPAAVTDMTQGRGSASPQGALALKVLLAEDNYVNQLVARALLTRLGCTVASASDGEAVLALARQQAFDVILMDCHMPRLDGYQATAALRERERLEGGAGARGVVIIGQSANAMADDRERCMAAGMDDFLAKPITADVLAQTLLRWSAGR